MILIQEIEDYQLRELVEEKIFLNKYDLSLKYFYELIPYWKAFFFDIIIELDKKNIEISKDNNYLFYLENYQNIIDKYELKIDINDYIELVDYISFQEWRHHPNTEVKFLNNKILLLEFQ